MGREFGWGTVPCQIGRGNRFVSGTNLFVSESVPIVPTAVAGSYWEQWFPRRGVEGMGRGLTDFVVVGDGNVGRAVSWAR